MADESLAEREWELAREEYRAQYERAAGRRWDEKSPYDEYALRQFALWVQR